MPKTKKPKFLKPSQLEEGKSYKAFSPDGLEIEGSYDLVPGVALMGGVTVTEGKVTPDYVDQTDMNWDGQYTVTKRGKRLFADTKGNLWPEHKLLYLPSEVGASG